MIISANQTESNWLAAAQPDDMAVITIDHTYRENTSPQPDQILSGFNYLTKSPTILNMKLSSTAALQQVKQPN